MKTKNTIYISILTAFLLTGCSQNNASPPETTTAPETTASETMPTSIAEGVDLISSEDAKAIALTHAGLTEDQVTFIKSELDRDNDDHNYDVEFYTEDRLEYDYEIDAYTGRIIGYDLDGEYTSGSGMNGTTPVAGNGVENSVSESTGNNSNVENDGMMASAGITEEEAKKIALEQVPGATEEDFLEFGRDFDDGRLIYEVEILYDQKEYDFEIDAQDGSILEWNSY